MISGNIRDLNQPNILYDQNSLLLGEYDQDEVTEIYMKVRKMEIGQILERLSKIHFLQMVEDQSQATIDTNKIWEKTLVLFLSEQTGLAQNDHIEYFLDSVREVLILLERRIKEIEKFKEHRHKTIAGLYTEKAVY